MDSLFNTPDNTLFLGIKSDNELAKATKGTPGYEEWLRKYRMRRNIFSGESFFKDGKVYRILQKQSPTMVLVEDQDQNVEEIDLTEDLQQLEAEELEALEERADTEGLLLYDKDTAKVFKKKLTYRPGINPAARKEPRYIKDMAPQQADLRMWSQAVDYASEIRRKHSAHQLDNRLSCNDAANIYGKMLANSNPARFLEIFNS